MNLEKVRNNNISSLEYCNTDVRSSCFSAKLTLEAMRINFVSDKPR